MPSCAIIEMMAQSHRSIILMAQNKQGSGCIQGEGTYEEMRAAVMDSLRPLWDQTPQKSAHHLKSVCVQAS